MNDLITKDDLKNAVPEYCKNGITNSLVEKLNNLNNSYGEEISKAIKDNFITYSIVLNEGKYSMEEYLNAIKFVTFRRMGYSNIDAYQRTFPERYINLLNKNLSKKDISAYVSGYARGKLVIAILDRSYIPIWIANMDVYQKAIDTLSTLMGTAESELVQCKAAEALITHLAKPIEKTPTITINTGETSTIDSLKETIVTLAKTQQELIKNGMKTKDIASANIIEVTND